MTRMLQTVTDTARDVVGVQYAITIYLGDESSSRKTTDDRQFLRQICLLA